MTKHNKWQVEWDDRALKELQKLSRPVQRTIIEYLRNRIATTENPKRFGKPLKADKFGLWSYRIEDYRLICRIEENRLVVLILRVGHRKDVYN